jgi:S-adenosylmethionine hydrolase
MPIITLTTDFGLKDHYAASVKGALFRLLPSAVVVDITHLIPSFNFGEAAYVLSHAFREFPEGSIHVVSVGSEGEGRFNHVALKLHGHYFIGCDNGIFSLLSTEETPEMVVEICAAGKEPSTFVARDLYLPVAVKLAKGVSITLLGPSQGNVTQRIRQISPPEEDVLKGIVVNIDSFGNFITNITGDDFDRVGKGRLFSIDLIRDKIAELHVAYGDVSPGEKVAFFNSSGVLEIAINNGNASKLLSLRLHSVVRITFQ